MRTTVTPPAGTDVSVPAGHPWLRRLLLVNLVAEVAIVVTGGLVRLTGSGLGCPTWPECVPGSYTPVVQDSVSYHPYIEFGNRLVTFVVGAAVIAVIVGLMRWAPHRRGLLPWAWVVLAGVLAQAVVGGVTVRTGLHPATVSFHFLMSMVLVAASTVLVWRERQPDGPSRRLVPALVERTGWATGAVAAVVLALGTVVTGSGPHSGDAVQPARFGFDPRTISWLHADAVMLFSGLVVAMLLAVHLIARQGEHAEARTETARTAWRAVLLVTVAQGLIGYTQYLTGLPEVLVLVHMLGAALLAVTVTLGVLSLRTRDPLPLP